MRILIAAGVPRRHEGGVAAVVHNLGRELECLGHQVTYVFLEDLIKANSVRPRFRELVFSYRLARYILANRNKFTVVNLHAPAGLLYGILRQLSPRNELPPYVMTLHGLEERRVRVMTWEDSKGRAWHFGWKNRAWHRFYHFPRFRWSIHTANGANACARDVWNYLTLRYKMNHNSLAYIPHGVDSRFFQAREYRVLEKPRLLYIGTWLDQRGIFYIRDALRSLLAINQEFAMTFVGTGCPDAEILEFFGSDLASRIQVLKAVPQDQIHRVYAEHDIFVFPSLVEGLPCVLMEAMAAGMPVITTETCGMPDIVEDDFNGLLIPPADSAALEKAILALARSESLRARLGRAASESMRRYTWSRAGRSFSELLIRVVTQTRDLNKVS